MTHRQILPTARPTERPFLYDQSHCWQYDIRLRNREQDLADAQLSAEQATNLKVSDLTFRYVDKSESKDCQAIAQFVRRHEWLGTMPLHPTHRFVAKYQGHLAGVIIFSMPTAFSTLLGADTKNLERLIARGASVSWAPKCTASSMLMWAVNWMLNNTQFRLFTCYADVEARELGTIYQSCNFTYLGKKSGARRMYYDPADPARGWFSDRSFRSRSAYKRYAHALGLEWQKDWSKGDTIYWDRMPTAVVQQLRAYAKVEMERCQSRAVPPKHKYALIKGKDRTETKKLLRRFAELNPTLVALPYPKER